MKNLKLMIVLAGLMSLAPMVTASAETEGHKYNKGVEARQEYQQRIDRDDRRGSWSWRDSDRDRDDKHVAEAERSHLRHDWNYATRRVDRDHDGDRR